METKTLSPQQKTRSRIIEFSVSIISLFALAEATIQVIWVAF